VEAGGVVTNRCGTFPPGSVPFGSVQKSGIGRENLISTLEETTQEKSIAISGVRTQLTE
jgi:acyl-CoA reductase-like NAD-dependent aldehyde dehydrogenase